MEIKEGGGENISSRGENRVNSRARKRVNRVLAMG